MSQKYIKSQNKNSHNAKSYGKYYATAVYDNHFIGTEELADFIQQQASVKKSDIKAVLDELGAAMKHYFELGQKVKLDGIGIMKVGFSSIGVARIEDCTSATITTRRVLFQPETERVVVGQEKKSDGSVKQKYVNAITLLKDVVFEETHDNAMNAEPEDEDETNTNSGNEGGNSSSQQGDNSQQGSSQNGGQSQQSGFALTIATSGSGSSTVTLNGSSVTSGASLNEDDEVEISITPAEGQTPTATLNGSSIELTENEGVYTGNFAMPGQASTLIINTGSTGYDGGDGGEGLDKD
jgi:predicted histone-like DNA-binding protein